MIVNPAWLNMQAEWRNNQDSAGVRERAGPLSGSSDIHAERAGRRRS